MKKLITVVGAALTAITAMAGAHWFDAGIESYEAWPEDGTDKEIAGVGTWSNTEGAVLEGETDERYLSVSTSKMLSFDLSEPRTLDDQPVVQTRVLMSPSEEMPEGDQTVKGALAVVVDTTVSPAATNYYGIVADQAAGTNVWVKMTGLEPDTTKPVFLEIAFRENEGVKEVCYIVDQTTLLNGEAEWSPVFFPVEDDTVTGIGYSGTGEVRLLKGETDDSGTVIYVTMTIPALESMTVTSVSVGGVDVPVNPDGTYTVPAGRVVAVNLAAADGYFLSRPFMEITPDGDFELPVGELPAVTAASEVLRVSEIMASNETYLRTAGGVGGLDWVEIENTSDYPVDLTGWKLSDKVPSKNKWVPIEGSAVVPAHGYLVVFVDTDFTKWNGKDAHAAIGLSGSGEDISFATPGGTLVSTFNFGQQFKDVSYGYGHRLNGSRDSLNALDAMADAQYRVGEGEWKNVKGPLGMSADEEGFTVVAYAFAEGKYPTTSADVDSWIYDSESWREAPVTNTYQQLCFVDGNGSNSFANAVSFPCDTANGGFALISKGTITIPRDGLWSFGVGSDDGFTAKISRLGQNWTWEFDGTRDYGMTTATFNLDAGAYEVELVYWRYGDPNLAEVGASFEFCIAEGAYAVSMESPDFDATPFALVGSDESGIAFAGAYDSKIMTDLSEELVEDSETLTWQGAFELAEAPNENDEFKLNIRYSDGFVAMLNGHQIASVELGEVARTSEEAQQSEFFDIPLELVHEGENTLEIVSTSNGDGEFFLSSEVAWGKAAEELVYFDHPTARAANNYPGRMGLTPVVTLSERHGWKSEPFTLTMSCAEDPTADIYYTTDGTQPTVNSSLYEGPITISKTTVIRAAVPNKDALLQNDASATYLFVEDILQQGDNPADQGYVGFPIYGKDNTNGQVVRYGFGNNNLIVNGTPEEKRKIYDGFTNSTRTVSLVIDPKNLFDPAKGIYVNAGGDGRTWERPLMVEQINPMDPTDEYTAPCGIRIRGAFSRGAPYPKHSFRLFFRSDYGLSNLQHPLFGKEGADEFDKIDLRTDQNYSYANGNGGETLITELFSRDSERDMGKSSYHRTRFFNLFINGVYWGVYMYEERCCQEYAASYNGGQEENYDVVRTSQPGYSTGTVEGENAGMANFLNIYYNQGFGENYPNNYNKVRGLNPDGTRNPDYPVYLNITNTILYCLSAHFVGDSDSPSSGGTPNNIAAFRNRVDGEGKEDGWMFNRHDAEHSMGYNYGGNKLTHNITGWGTREYGCWQFNPAGLHYELCANAEYRQIVADLFYKNFLREGGAMTAPNCEKRLRDRMAEIDDVIVAEAARWGWNGCTYQNWLNNCEGNCVNFVKGRIPYFLAEYRARGWYPNVDAPAALDANKGQYQDGTKVENGAKLYLSGSSRGTVYYTTDGSDPRLEGGAVNTDHVVTYEFAEPVDTEIAIMQKGAEWKYYDAGSLDKVDWTAEDFDDSAWSSGAAPLGVTGSGVGSVTTPVNRYLPGTGTQVMTYYFRQSFNVDAAAAKTTRVTVNAFVDDGCVVYLNGQVIGSYNMPTTTPAYDTTSSSGINPSGDIQIVCDVTGILKEGANVLAVEVHQCNTGSTDLVWDSNMTYTKFADETQGIEIPAEGLHLKARILSESGEWSALEEVELEGTAPVAKIGDSLRFAEFCGVPVCDDDNGTGEYVVLTNLSETTAFDLTGVRVALCKVKDYNKTGLADAKMNVVIPEGTIPAGGTYRLDRADYETGWTKITNGDLVMVIQDQNGNEIQHSTVNQDNFPTVCDANMLGASLIATSFDAVTTEADWKASFSLEYAFLRFFAFDGIPADGLEGDTQEWFALTNTSAKFNLDLTGVRVVIGKRTKGALVDADSKMNVVLGEGALGPSQTNRFEQADFADAGWTKITNGELIIRLYDAEGALIQESSVNQKTGWDKYYGTGGPGGADCLVATSFEHLTTDADWIQSSDIVVIDPEATATPEEGLRVIIAMSSTADDGDKAGDNDGSEYIVLTNITDKAISLAGVRLVAWNAAKKTEADASLTIALEGTIEAGATLTLEKANGDFGTGKLTNSDVGMKLYNGVSLVQELFFSADWWGKACDGTGNWFIATDFGSEVKSIAQWKPSATTYVNALRVLEVMSSTKDGSGDGSEFIVFTNLSADAKLDLAGVRVTCAKPGKDPSLDLTIVTNELKIAKGGKLTLRKADFWPTAKITNGEVNMAVYDAAGTLVQTLYFSADWFNAACKGTGAFFIATDFGAEVTAESQWKPSFTFSPDLPSVPDVIAEVVATDDVKREWLAKVGATPEGSQAIASYEGTAETLETFYLLDVPPSNEELKLEIPEIGFDDEGNLIVGGTATLGGTEVTPHVINGTIKLRHYTTLGGEVIDETKLGNVLPLPADLKVFDKPAEGDAHFYRLVVE